MEPVTVGKMAANRQKAIYTQHNLQIYMHTKFHKHFMNVHQNWYFWVSEVDSVAVPLTPFTTWPFCTHSDAGHRGRRQYRDVSTHDAADDILRVPGDETIAQERPRDGT